MRLKTFLLGIVSFLLFSQQFSYAANNKFGIHLAVASEEDIIKASELVNGNDGAYGYITLVIEEHKRDKNQWQHIFDVLREKKLIPIVRLATKPAGNAWEIPKSQEATSWANFLDSLNWVTKDRYIVLFNETNHSSEWGGLQPNPTLYGSIAAEYATTLKTKSSDFKVMLGGLDMAAPDTPPQYMSASSYTPLMIKSFCQKAREMDADCKNLVDVIASHAYPNPGFSGSPYATGQMSVRSYEYEISWYLSYLGKSLPVLITETGWDSEVVGQSMTASYFEAAYRDVWGPDERVIAVTPFILNYQGEPFLKFSFLQKDSAMPHLKYLRLQSMPKTAGKPEIRDEATIKLSLPKSLIEGSHYTFESVVTNIGQKIWEEGEYFLQVVDTSSAGVYSKQVMLPKLKPLQHETVKIALFTKEGTAQADSLLVAQIRSKEGVVTKTFPASVHINPKPKLEVKVPLFLKGLQTGDDYELQIFDENEQLVFKRERLSVVLGSAQVSGIANVIPGNQYRAVILKPYYLPRQAIFVPTSGENRLNFEQLLPFDFDRDGALSIKDMGSMINKNSESDLSFGQKLMLLLP